MVDHYELRPVYPATESDIRDPTSWGRAPDRHAPETALDVEVVDVALATGEFGQAFATVHARLTPGLGGIGFRMSELGRTRGPGQYA
jgi:hypothetical protein